MMRVALPLMLVAGAAIGLAWPSRHDPAPVAANRAVPSAPAPRPTLSPTLTQVSGETVIPRDASGHFVANAVVNGVALPMIVDTGADAVALTVDDARAAHLTVDPNTFMVIGRGASGEVRGMIVTLDSVTIGGRSVGAVRGAVVEGLTRSLLGQSYLSRAGGVTMKNDEMRLS